MIFKNVMLIIALAGCMAGAALQAGTVRYRVVDETQYVYQTVPTNFFIVEGWYDGVLSDSVLVRIDGDYMMVYGDLINGTPVYEDEPNVIEKVTNIEPGDMWVSYLEDYDSYETAVGEVSKTVPAGTFTAMEIDMYADPDRTVYIGKRWLAEGVGLLGYEGEYLGLTTYQQLTAYVYAGGTGYWPLWVGNDLYYESGQSMEIYDAPHATITLDGNPSDWAAFDPAVEDPEGDDPGIYNGMDIRELYIANDDTTMYMMFTFWDGAPSTAWGGSRYGAYQVCVLPDDDESEEIGWISYYDEGDFWFLSPLNFDFDGTVTACGTVMECSIPLANLNFPDSLYRYSLNVGDMEEDYDKSDMVTVRFTYSDPSCCQGRVGDANHSQEDEPTLGDVSAIIAALFIQATVDPIAACIAEADINQSGGADPQYEDITIGDIYVLIDYFFIKGPYDPVTNPGGVQLPECL